MRRMMFVFVTVVLLAGCSYGIYQWALLDPVREGCRSPHPISKALDEADVLLATAKRKLQKFDEWTVHIGRVAEQSLNHSKVLAEKEAKMAHNVENIEDETEKGNVLHDVDECISPVEETGLYTAASGEKLTITGECLQCITNERMYFEELHKKQIRSLRLAPSQRQAILLYLSTLETKVELFRERWRQLDQSTMNTDQHMALYSEIKLLLQNRFCCPVGPGHDADITTGISKCHLHRGRGDATSRALDRINALLGSK